MQGNRIETYTTLKTLMELMELPGPPTFPDPGALNPHLNLNSNRVPARTRTNKSRDNNLKLGAKNPEGFSSRRTELLEPGFDSHSESPSQEKP